MPFVDNNASPRSVKTKRNQVIKSTLICSAALAGIMAVNPLATTTVKADTAATTQIETPTTDWVATKPADIHVDNSQKTYTLNRGDTLWAIAQATNTDVNQLAQLNNINLEAGDQYHLAVGLTIKLTADAQTDNDSNNNSNNNTNPAAQNSTPSNNDDNAGFTTTNNNSNAETPTTTNNDSATQTTDATETSPQNNSTTAANQATNGNSNGNSNNQNTNEDSNGSSNNQAADNQTANGSSNAGDAGNAGSGTNTDTTKNGQVNPDKSQVSKPADVIHNESSVNNSDKSNPQPTVSQSSTLSDGSNNSQTQSSLADKTSSSTPTDNNSHTGTPSSSANNTSNNNNGNTTSSSASHNSSTPTNSGSKANSSSVSNADLTSNAGSGPANINHSTNSSSSNANSNFNNGQSSSNSSSSSSSSNNNSSSSSSSSSNADNSHNTNKTSDYKQTAPLNDNDLAKVVALEKQLNDLKTQANTVANNLQFYQDFIDATKNANGTNPQDRLDKIDYQNTYYQKAVDGYSDMSDEQKQLTTIKAQLPIDDQTITNLQNQLAKPDITPAEKQTLTTDLNNAKATAVKDQETYQTLQAKINRASAIVAQYKALLARNADMTAALKGNGQTDNLVTQYQRYINDNQSTQNNLNAQITNINNQLKTYGVTLNS